MNHSSCAGPHAHAGMDIYPSEPFEDSFWLGAEAMIAPACLSDLRDVHDANRVADDEGADPDWRVI